MRRRGLFQRVGNGKKEIHKDGGMSKDTAMDTGAKKEIPKQAEVSKDAVIGITPDNAVKKDILKQAESVKASKEEPEENKEAQKPADAAKGAAIGMAKGKETEARALVGKNAFNSSDLFSIERINRDFRGGAIDEGTKVMMYLYALFDPSRLTREYSPQAPVKSGTTLVEEVHRYLRRDDADRTIVEKAKGYLSTAVPPLDRSFTSSSGHFTIHYTLKGQNAVVSEANAENGIPRYIASIGEAMEYTYKTTCITRGFKRPLLDPGKRTFDVYVYDLKGKYGITFPSNFYNSRISGSKVASCFIAMDNTYSAKKGFKTSVDGCIMVTAAHEFFHAVQNAYNADSDSWWKEASATWNEDEMYDSVNDYIQYLDSVFSSPGEPLEHSSYGGVIFAKYLSEKCGGYEMIRSIWETQAARYRNSINAIDYTLKIKFTNRDLGSVFGDFSASLYNPVQYYREGRLWNQQVAVAGTYDTYPVASKSGQLKHLSSSFILFRPFQQPGSVLKLSVSCSSETKWAFKVSKRRLSDGMCDEDAIIGDRKDNTGEISLSSFGKAYSEICLIPANLGKEQDNAKYTFSASLQ